ncbi:MAG: transposase family protein [Calditerrivibrio sp.]|nr:transposase family protein [Calditerrivibrio sp.]
MHPHVCHSCNDPSDSIHSYHERIVRNLNIFDAKTFIQYSYRKIRCSHCGIVIEDLKDYLKKLWHYKYARCAEKFLDYWCSLHSRVNSDLLWLLPKPLKICLRHY